MQAMPYIDHHKIRQAKRLIVARVTTHLDLSEEQADAILAAQVELTEAIQKRNEVQHKVISEMLRH